MQNLRIRLQTQTPLTQARLSRSNEGSLAGLLPCDDDRTFVSHLTARQTHTSLDRCDPKKWGCSEARGCSLP